MCDDQTEAENEAFIRKQSLTRRQMNLGAGAALTTFLTGCGEATPEAASPASPPPPPPPPPEDIPPPVEEAAPPQAASRRVTIKTSDGTCEGFFSAPSTGKHPGILIWPDVAGLRSAFETMGERLAGEGYAVLVVNPYYRSAKLPILSTFSEWKTDEGKKKIAPMREALTPERIAKDGAAFVAFLDDQPEVAVSKKIGTVGYCMGGPFTFRTSAAAADRVGVIASFHGGGLVTDEPTSPHRLFPEMKAAALVGVAQNDDERDPKAKETLRKAAEGAGRPLEIEVYPAQHGWCVIDSPVYDEEQAERAWARMLATFSEHL